MRNIIIVGLGGFAGSILRHLVSGWVHRLSDNPLFSCGTLGVNVPGCLAIGLVDTKEKIGAFLDLVDSAIGEGLATLEDVRIHFYRAGKQDPPDSPSHSLRTD
jgi:fluoride ion exporter CrcB/FEX